MTKHEFVKLVASKSGLSRRDAAKAVDAFLDSITDALRAGESVSFTGFGKFSVPRGGGPTNRQRGRHYQHLPLPRAKLRKGLATFSEEDVPSEALAVLTLEPKDIETRHGIRFAPSFDGLDSLKVAVLQLPSQRKVSLIRYTHAPKPGTLVAVHPSDVADPMTLTEVLDALDLDERELAWTRGRKPTGRRRDGEDNDTVPRFSPGSRLKGAVAGRASVR